MLHLEDPVASLQFVYQLLRDVGRHPALIALNLVLSAAVLGATAMISSFVMKRGRIAWALVFGLVLLGCWFCYFWEYAPIEAYKEADIPPGRFAHVVFLMMFPLAPLLAVIGYIAGGLWLVRFQGGNSRATP